MLLEKEQAWRSLGVLWRKTMSKEIQTLVFISNFLNHHQLPLALSLYELLGNGFRFIATAPSDPQRLAMGYHDMNKMYPFVLTTYDRADGMEEVQRLILESDVVMAGGLANVPFMGERLRRGKISFQCWERPFKASDPSYSALRTVASILWRQFPYRKCPTYLLAIGAYAPYDFQKVGCYVGHAYKWGYFPEVHVYDTKQLMQNKRSGKTELLWVGRMLRWKHPEDAVAVAEYLKNKGYDFTLRMIGEGEQREQMESLVRQKKLEDCVELLDFMSPEEVRHYMERANIYLFTSDRNEGWGAVLNESMNSCCAAVTSYEVGSSCYLIENGKNGLIYEGGNTGSLCEAVENLVNNPDYCETLGLNAYKTMTTMWNGKNAAGRLLELAQALLNGQDTMYEEGPCSKAEVITPPKNDV